MLRYKDYVYLRTLQVIVQVTNTGKHSYSFRRVCGREHSIDMREKSTKASCHLLIEQKEWIVGDLQTLRLLYGKR